MRNSASGYRTRRRGLSGASEGFGPGPGHGEPGLYGTGAESLGVREGVRGGIWAS